jgi:hypothetical protein
LIAESGFVEAARFLGGQLLECAIQTDSVPFWDLAVVEGGKYFGPASIPGHRFALQEVGKACANRFAVH